MVWYLRRSLAASSASTYMTGVRSYHNFCLSQSIIVFPVSQESLCYFVAAEANRGLGYNSIKVYLCGVLHQNTLLGFRAAVSDYPILFHMLRGIRRVQGNSRRRAPKLPITPQHMSSIALYIRQSNMPRRDKLMFMAAVLAAFFGLLRISEYTSPTGSRFDPSLHLTRDDISFNRKASIMFLRIKGSKTDPFRIGHIIRISSTSALLCPVTAMRSYLRSLPSDKLPLFRLDNGVFLTRRHIMLLLRQALPNIGNISTHSFRIGGASAALSAGASDALIKILGRWSSDSYVRYLRVSDQLIADFQRLMTRVSHTNIFY